MRPLAGLMAVLTWAGCGGGPGTPTPAPEITQEIPASSPPRSGPTIRDPRARWQPPPDPSHGNRDPVLTPLRNPPRPPPAGARDVILITVDTWRADRLALYGSPRPTSDWLSRFAARALVVERASSVAPWTWPSMVSIATSVEPRSHGVRSINSVLCENAETLAELFWRGGWHTGLIAANNYMEREGNGYRQGFEFYYGRGMEVADRVLEYAGYFLDGIDEGQPFFLHLHFYEPHCPFDPPAQDLGQATSVPGGPRGVDEAQLPPIGPALTDAVLCHVVPPIDLTQTNAQKNAAPRSQVRQYYYDAYDGELVEMDRRLADLEALLRARGRWDNAAVLLTGDHGEEFAEHGRVGHGNAVFREATWVPLLYRPPITEAPPTTVRTDQAISLLDVAPTLAVAAGLTPPASWSGQPLQPLLTGSTTPRPVIVQTDFETVARGVEWNGHHLVLPGAGLPALLFDTQKDPMDRHDLLAGKPNEVAQDLLDLLRKEEERSAAAPICPGVPLPEPSWSDAFGPPLLVPAAAP